ncbi:MAG: hypothetical protein ACI8P0_001144 [Planctomycetaceae bacterium]
MPKLNPFAALAEHVATLSELWAKDPNSLQTAIALAESDLDLLKAVVAIAESAPELLTQHAAPEQKPSPRRVNRVRRTAQSTKRSSTPKSAQNRSTNVGTTDAIMEFVAEHPNSTLREIVDEIGMDKDKVSATSAMLVKRGRLSKSVEDGLNRYVVKEE